MKGSYLSASLKHQTWGAGLAHWGEQATTWCIAKSGRPIFESEITCRMSSSLSLPLHFPVTPHCSYSIKPEKAKKKKKTPTDFQNLKKNPSTTYKTDIHEVIDPELKYFTA